MQSPDYERVEQKFEFLGILLNIYVITVVKYNSKIQSGTKI